MTYRKKPTILIFTDWYLPGFKAGGPISSIANLVEHLGDSHHIRIICSDRDLNDTQPYPNIATNEWQPVGKADVYYLDDKNSNYSTIKKNIQQVNPDGIYLNGIFSKIFSIFPLIAANKLKIKVIISPRGMFAPSALNIKSRKKSWFLKLVNLTGLYGKVLFHATNSHEEVHIRNAVKIAVDVHEIPNIPTIPVRVNRKSKIKGYLKILIVARVAPEKNLHFAIECLGKLSSYHQIEVNIAGPVYSQAYFEKCKQLATKAPVNVKINWLGGKSPHEIQPLYEEAHLFFLPSLGENYGHAIIEAMLWGVPALISDQTPWRNLENAGLGRDIALDNHAGFVDFIEKTAQLDHESFDNLYGNVSTKAAERIDLQGAVNAYKKLFG